MAETIFRQLGCTVIIGGGLVIALTRDEQQTIVVVQRAYNLTIAAARGMLNVGRDLVQASAGSWIVTHLSKALVKASTAAIKSILQATNRTTIYWAHFTLLSGYVRLHVFGEGFDTMLVDEREQERVQRLLISMISGQNQLRHDARVEGHLSDNVRNERSNGKKGGKLGEQENIVGENKNSRRNGYKTADYIKQGRQYCVGVKPSGDPCGRNRLPLESPYFCCEAHRVQFKASDLLMERIEEEPQHLSAE